jgi:carbon storage regulator CsrA
MQEIIVELRIGQKVRLGDNVVVMLSDVAQKRCSIGIKAPKNVRILRSELVEDVCVSGDINNSVTGHMPSGVSIVVK